MENTTHRSPPQQPEQPNDDGMETSECNGSSLGGRGRLEVEADEVKEEGIRGESEEGENGGEKVKRHRNEMAGGVWIPEIWGQAKKSF
ncbi:hypothetical protein V6N13_148727 [Hibiscus sabdariffa]